VTNESTQPPQILAKLFELLKKLWQQLVALYHPDNLKQQGARRSVILIALTALLPIILIGWWWSIEPSLFDVQAVAQQQATHQSESMVTGYVTTYTLITIANTLLDKSGGYLSNDIIFPSIFMDDMPNWEFGVLQQVREFTKVLRNDISRSKTQSIEDSDLAKAEPKFNADNQSWFWPTSETEYQEGIEFLNRYLHRLADPQNNTAQFLTRADNLRDWLEEVVKRLGGLSQQLSASVGQLRINTDLAGEINQATSKAELSVKTPWSQIDNVFYQARGTCWALIHLLRAVAIDFKEVLAKRNATVMLQQIIRELEMTQKTVWSPMILNGSGLGLFANHSLVLSSYISRANIGIMELYNLL
jgi:hypothetical protein